MLPCDSGAYSQRRVAGRDGPTACGDEAGVTNEYVGDAMT
jgi:hypothetical protein